MEDDVAVPGGIGVAGRVVDVAVDRAVCVGVVGGDPVAVVLDPAALIDYLKQKGLR